MHWILVHFTRPRLARQICEMRIHDLAPTIATQLPCFQQQQTTFSLHRRPRTGRRRSRTRLCLKRGANLARRGFAVVRAPAVDRRPPSVSFGTAVPPLARRIRRLRRGRRTVLCTVTSITLSALSRKVACRRRRDTARKSTTRTPQITTKLRVLSAPRPRPSSMPPPDPSSYSLRFYNTPRYVHWLIRYR